MTKESATDRALIILGALISLVHLYFNTIGILPGLWQNAIHFAGFALICPLIYPLGDWRRPWQKWADLLLGLAAAGSAVYMIAMEDAIYDRGVRLALPEWIFGIILILAAIELTRRTTGLIIPALILISLSYVGFWGGMIDGVFEFKSLSPETILFRSIYGDDALFGNIATISSTFVFMFILFGAFLLKSGAGDFVIDLARAAAGRLPGGPGLVAVFASGLTGTISGSAIANTASTGVITIPLMKKAGFPPKFAAGVEAAASTGGQVMPPIMGAGAFVMASYTQISYTTIIAVSVLPAILYFATVAFFVMIEARRIGIRPETGEDAPKALAVIREGGLPFILPITLLIGMLVYGFTPSYAAAIAIVSVVVFSWLTPRKIGFRDIIDALALGARNMAMTAILLCAVGLVVNVIATTGIGNTFSLMISNWAGNSLMIALVLIALASLVLGMGLPVTASYIVLGTLSAPALYSLILDLRLIDLMVSGNLPEQAGMIMSVVNPEALSLLAQPMTEDAAQALLTGLPLELTTSLREMVFSPEILTYALLSAHMIIFWLSQDSNVTPPVCLCGFTAAAIAETPPMATGLSSWKIAKGLYLVPLLFAYTPILGGSLLVRLEIFAFAFAGLFALAAGFQGFLSARLNFLQRLLLVAAGAAMLWPGQILIHAAGLLTLLGFWTWQHKTKARDMAGA